MARLTSFLVMLMLSVGLTHAQFSQDFTDADLLDDPAWNVSNYSGDGDFKVIDGMLQSDGPVATAAIWISTSVVPENYTNSDLVWKFKVQYASSPSSSNAVRIFLINSEADLTQGDGYYIKLGESGSNDGIDLYKTSQSSPIIADTSASVANGIDVNIQVTRFASGMWQVKADDQGADDFRLVGEAVDNEFVHGSYFGLQVNHTSTRNTSFFFDDLSLTVDDTSAPQLLSAKANQPDKISLLFSEPIAPSALNKELYSLSQESIKITEVNYGESDEEVILQLSEPMLNGAILDMSVENIYDLHGNVLVSAEFSVIFLVDERAAYKDIVINEFMADPTPANQLPEAEFIELYNRSAKVINLARWTFADGSTTGILDSLLFFPGDHVILTASENTSLFESFGKTAGLKDWPSINNGGDVFVLKDKHGAVIDSVNFDDSWYKSSVKSEGGWSLELIDADNLCSYETNWAASESDYQGTPGQVNSVKAENPDLTAPVITEVWALQPDSITIKFDEPLERESIGRITCGIKPDLAIDRVVLSESTKLVVVLRETLQTKMTYQLVLSNIEDCSGNIVINLSSDSFNLIEKADSTDILISEILFNPLTGGVDFVEIHNRSDKFINLKGLALGTSADILQDQKETVIEEDLVIEPGEYFALTERPIVIQEQYLKSIPENLIEVKNLPSYPDVEGTVALYDQDDSLLDLMNYSESMHFSLLEDVEGVSLERVSFEASSLNPDNWKSAASGQGYATPGYENSQRLRSVVNINDQIVVSPKVIFPNGGGESDYAVINYSFDKPGYVANARVLDLHGNEVMELANNDYLGQNGFYTWDGTRSDGRKAKVGYYLIYIEAFSPDGSKMAFKEKIVVGAKL